MRLRRIDLPVYKRRISRKYKIHFKPFCLCVTLVKQARIELRFAAKKQASKEGA